MTVMTPSEQRQEDEELRESQKLYQSVVENTSAIILRVDPHAVITFANRRALEFFGYSADELIGKHAVETIVPPQETSGRDLAKLIDEISLNPDHFRSNANENICKDGRRVWVEWTNSGIYDEDGKLKEFLAVGIDATDRKRAEESEQRLIALMNHNPSPVFLKDECGRYVYLNEAYEKRFALTKGWLGKTDYDFWSKESADMFRAHDAEVLRSGKTEQFLEDSSDKTGKRYCWLCYKFPFTDAAGARFVGGIGIDVTARVLAEEALHATEERFRVAQELSPDGFLILHPERDADGMVVDFTWLYANATVVRMTNTELEQLVGRRLLETFPSNAGTSFFEAYVQVAQTGKPMVVEDTYQGETFPTPTWFRVAVVRTGEDIAVLVQDITDRKQSELQIAKSLDDLRRAQQELVRNERLATVGKLAGSVAHEMRTPLTVIRSSMFFLEQCLPTKERDVREAFAEVKRAIVSSDHIISEMLDYVREPTPCDSVFAVRDAISHALHSVPLPETIRFRAPSLDGGTEIMVRANQEQFTRILTNLIQNAIQAMPDGGELEISTKLEASGRICVSVRDTGCGIPTENLGKIFEPLFSTKTIGIGLGLAIAKRCADLNGAELSVESEPGRGTTFRLSLKSANER